MTTENQKHVAELKTALNKLSDLTGGIRCQEGDTAMCEAWVAMLHVERDALGPVAPRAVA